MAGDADTDQALSHLPKDGAARSERTLENFQPGVSEAAVSVAGKLSTINTVSEAGKRNVCDV